MFETPTEVKSDLPHDVVLAATFLLLKPAVAAFFGWLVSVWNEDYGLIGAHLGGITCLALSVGFSLSAIRHPVGRWGRPLGWVMLVLTAFLSVGPVFA